LIFNVTGCSENVSRKDKELEIWLKQQNYSKIVDLLKKESPLSSELLKWLHLQAEASHVIIQFELSNELKNNLEEALK